MRLDAGLFRFLLVAMMLACCVPFCVLRAQERAVKRERRSDNERVERQAQEKERIELHRVLEGLERGMESLRSLGRLDDVARLERIADGVRHELKQGQAGRPATEREVAQEQLEVMHIAIKALREGEKRDAVEILERAIHAREVALEGRRDEEAQKVREGAPDPGTQAEVLGLASRLWREYGHVERSEVVGHLSRQLAARSQERQRGRERREPRQREGAERSRRGNDERAEALRQLEVMRLALPALREAERKDAAELLERAIRAREVTLEGRRDEEAQEIRNGAPKIGDQAEILVLASRLWREFDNADKAEAVGALAEQFLARHQRTRARSAEREGGERDRPRREREGERPVERQREGREAAVQQLKLMRMALDAAKELDNEDATFILNRAVQATVVEIKEMQGEEAKIVRERKPSLGNQIEALSLVARLLREKERLEKAEQIERLVGTLRAKSRREKD